MLPLHKLFEATVTPNTEQSGHMTILKKNTPQNIPLKTINVNNDKHLSLSKDAESDAKGIVRSIKFDAGKKLFKHIIT